MTSAVLLRTLRRILVYFRGMISDLLSFMLHFRPFMLLGTVAPAY